MPLTAAVRCVCALQVRLRRQLADANVLLTKERTGFSSRNLMNQRIVKGADAKVSHHGKSVEESSSTMKVVAAAERAAIAEAENESLKARVATLESILTTELRRDESVFGDLVDGRLSLDELRIQVIRHKLPLQVTRTSFRPKYNRATVRQHHHLSAPTTQHPPLTYSSHLPMLS